MNADLRRERGNVPFDIKQFREALYGSEMLRKVTKLYKLMANNKCFDLSHLWNITNVNRYMKGAERAEEFVKICRHHNLCNDMESLSVMQVLVGDDFFLHLHITMFLTTLEQLCDKEQRTWWITKARHFRIIGTYAQTELGHGSNVAALQTLAELDLETDEWVINTPTLQSTKWWPGGLAKSSTHCVLMARLIIQQKDFGVHCFMLPIRDMRNHRSLPGVILIHMGHKMGYNTMDNGGMQLNQTRIPRRYLLSRFVKVDKNGNYSKVGDQKLLYATMTYTRKQIIAAAGLNMAKSATIAIRYSIVRRQFSNTLQHTAKEEELQVLDYSTQQHQLFPILASAVIFHVAGRQVDLIYGTFMSEIERNDFSRLSEMHSLTSALKAAMTSIVCDNMEICRRACGGHGFMLAAGIPLHLCSYAPQVTYEGDFVILSIQVGRELLKLLQIKIKGGNMLMNRPDSVNKYINEADLFEENGDILAIDLLDAKWQLSCLQKRSLTVLAKSGKKFMEMQMSGLAISECLDTVKIDFMRLCKAHCQAIVVGLYHKFMGGLQDERLLPIFKLINDIYVLALLEKEFGEFVVTKCINSQDYETITDKLKELYKKFRSSAVGVCDAFGIPDNLLISALGRYDGNVYEALYNSTKLEPMNETDVTDAYYRHLQFILHPERKAKI